jgi:branched-chain amino acid transport system ATP-binding protein
MALPLLEVQGVSKRFGGLLALSNVDLSLPEGAIFGLIGPNGAGKTTLFNVLSGFLRQDEGVCRLRGKTLPVGKPEQRAAMGLARTFQNIRLFGEQTVLENVRVGQDVRYRSTRWGWMRSGALSLRTEAEAEQAALGLLAYVGLSVLPSQKASTLSYGDQRRLELARALACQPALIALDEPAAGMNPTETAQLATLIRRIRDDGVGVFLIEHDVGFVMDLCDHVAVLDFGQKIAEGPPAAIRKNPDVIRAYLGRSAL